MDNHINDIIKSINFSMFKVDRTTLDPRILKETVFFREEFRKRYTDLDFIHSHLNKIADAWDPIITDNFKNKVKVFNNKLYDFRLMEAEKQRKMINLANKIEADKLFSSLGDLGINPDNDILTSFRKAKISKRKGPSRKRLN